MIQEGSALLKMIDDTALIEVLRCAEINCDNIKTGGLIFVAVVKAQIQEALLILKADPVTEEVFPRPAPGRLKERKPWT
jgi:hypothetical protein